MLSIEFARGEFVQNIHYLKQNLDLHEFEIVMAIHEKVQRGSSEERGPARTEMVLTALSDLGKKFGYETRGKHSGSPEWLFDFVWINNRENSWLHQDGYENDNTWAKFAGIKLACESEWHGHSRKVLEDFVKLTVVKSDYRLFVHSNQYYDIEKKINTVDLCKSVIPFSTGERYLFVGFDQYVKNNNFRIDLIQA